LDIIERQRPSSRKKTLLALGKGRGFGFDIGVPVAAVAAGWICVVVKGPDV
jgi:hypothetical protein